MNLSNVKNQKWVIGVSGGPDSMALLDQVNKVQLKCFVVHVNYHKRETAQRDQRIVEDYCTKHSIPYSIEDAPDFLSGNFQDQARRFRYNCMLEKVKALSYDAIVVAHHKDDDLETYLFQKKRNSNVDTYGLKELSYYKDCLLIRPLLQYSKQDLIDYCVQNEITYGLDESNSDPKYSRNLIRQELTHMSEEDKRLLLLEKEARNQVRENYLKVHQSLLSLKTIHLKDYLCLEDKEHFLIEWLKYHKVNKALSHLFLKELNRQIIESEALNILIKDLRLIKQYGDISLLQKSVKSYSYTLDTVKNIKTDEFELIFTENAKNHIKFSDFPLTIKNACGTEMVGSKRLNRWFIKHKIPLIKRELWPVIYATNGKLIYVAKSSFSSGLNANKITLSVVK